MSAHKTHINLDPQLSLRSINARAAGIVIVLVVGILSGSVSDGYSLYFAVFMVVSLVLNFWRKKVNELFKHDARWFIAENLADVAGVFFIALMTGGSSSIFQILYIFPLIYVVMMRGVRTGMLIAFAASSLVLITGFLEVLGSSGGAVSLSEVVTGTTAGIILVALLGTAIYSGYFAEEILRQRKKLLRFNERLSDRTVELMRGKEKLENFNNELRQARDDIQSYNQQLSLALDQIKLQEKKVSAVLGSVASGIFLVDRTQKIEMWNQAAGKILGYSADEVLGRTCREILRPAAGEAELDCSTHCEIHHITGHGAKIRSYDLHVLNKGGDQLWINVVASAVTDDTGNTVGIVHVFHNVTAEHQDRAVLRKQAITDELTELFNRRFLQARLNEEMERAKRYSQPIALLMADIDHFKRINDEHGHAAGDAVLRELAALFRRNLRRSDFIARYGGEEFIIILPNVKEENPVDVAEKIREAVEKHHFKFEEMTLSLQISMGVVVYGGEEISAADFLKFADNALYMAKRGGRNRVISLPIESS